MTLNKLKQPLIRLAKIAGAAAVAAVIGYLTNHVGLFGDEYSVAITVLLIPALSAVEKAISGPTVKA